MKCKSCGGNIVFRDGLAVCENCDNQYKIEGDFENIEVFICYVENDVSGRRTRDSIVAQDVYNRLDNAKIHTFYERVSVGNLWGEDLEKAYYSAVYNAKIILLVGTNQNNFEEILQKYQQFFGVKKIIPVCADMNPQDLPNQIRTLQALNYDSIGASSDLLNSVLTSLGRKGEVDVIKIARKAQTTRRIIVISVFLVIILILGGIIGSRFWKQNQKAEEVVEVDTRPEDYAYAQELIEQEKYSDAMNILVKLGDYENSKNILSGVYEKYEGYYLNEKTNIAFHLSIADDYKTDVEIDRNVNGEIVRITEAGEMKADKAEFNYVDSENNSGKMSFVLKNDSVVLHTDVEGESELSIGKQEIKFLLSEKSDEPITKDVDATMLLNWLSNRVSINEIIRTGYELKVVNDSKLSRSINMFKACLYRIKNTDIFIAAIPYDFTSTVPEEAELAEGIVYGVSAPATLLIPKKIGGQAKGFVQGKYLYLPGGEFHGTPEGVLGMNCAENKGNNIIENETQVAVECKTSWDKWMWQLMIDYIGDENLEE